jgi:hypothetical protein
MCLNQRVTLFQELKAPVAFHIHPCEGQREMIQVSRFYLGDNKDKVD